MLNSLCTTTTGSATIQTQTLGFAILRNCHTSVTTHGLCTHSMYFYIMSCKLQLSCKSAYRSNDAEDR